jgi:hypothetical protein
MNRHLPHQRPRVSGEPITPGHLNAARQQFIYAVRQLDQKTLIQAPRRTKA